MPPEELSIINVPTICLTQPDRTEQVAKEQLSFHLKEDFPLTYFLCGVVEKELTLDL